MIANRWRNHCKRQKQKTLPRRRRAVTIAAGFHVGCTHHQGGRGVLVCADTEISGGDVNIREPKIFQVNLPKCNANLAIAYAGTVATAKMAVQRLKYKFLAQSGELTEERIIDLTATELHDFHEKHVFHHPQYRYADGPQVNLIIAVQNRSDRKVSLFSSSEDFVICEDSYTCIGAGEMFAKYVIAPLLTIPVSQQPLKRVLQIASHALYQVKKYVPDCGGYSQYVYLGENGDFHPMVESRLLPIATYSETFEAILADTFYALSDLNLNDAEVGMRLRLTDDRIAKIRKEQRAERQRQQELLDKLFAEITMPSDSQKLAGQQ